MPHPDQKYIDALLNNNVVVLDELYKKFSYKIKSLVVQNHGNETDAADILQDALLAIYHKALNENLILTCPFEAFLFIIARNKWLKELARRKKTTVTNVDIGEYNIGEDCVIMAEECLLHEDRNELLNQKMAELGEGCKKLLRLSWSGKPMEEVAKILNITYSYARKKKCECMSQLVVLIKRSSAFNSLKW